MTPMQLLKKDHSAVKRLFAEFKRTTGRAVKKRRELIQKIGAELEIHARIEEELFYPAMAEIDAARDLVGEAREEHRHVKELIVEVRGLEPDDRGSQAELVARMKELRQAVVHHASEEEHEMFPLAERLGKERLQQIAEQFRSRKDEVAEELMPGKRAHRRAA